MKLASLALVTGFAGCVSSAPLDAQKAAPRAAPTVSPAPARPLARLVSEHILVLPVQYLVFADSMGWSAAAPSSRSYLTTLDDEIAFALGERGLRTQWKFASDAARSVARNPGFASDPYALAAGQVRWGVKADAWQLAEPLASQLRALVALTDARYVMLPVEVRLTGSRGAGRALLHVVVIDARRSQIQWAGDVFGTPATSFTPAIAADLASHLADLVAAPAN